MIFIILAILTFVCFIAAVSIPSTVQGSYGKTNLTWLKAVSVIAAVIFALTAIFQLITIVPAGHIGIVDTFGNVATDVKFPGLNMINPFAKVPKMSVQTQEI